ncbi:hypothetical protein GCM10020331_086820 [Ectobacillus funiculus]
MKNGNIIGIVSVGFLMEDINQIVGEYDYTIWGIALSGAVIGIIGSVYLARNIKKI